jgi:hypothetical protein
MHCSRSARYLTRNARVLRAFVIAVLALPAFASMTTTALTGRVIIGNAPGANVTVTVTSSALQGERSTITSARGTYWIEALPPGTYDVTFSKPGHTTLTRRAIVELARVARADAKLEPNEDEETVTSTASTLTVAETTAITSHITREGLQRLPVESTPRGAISVFLPSRFETASLDGAPFAGAAIGEELVDNVTIIHAAAGAEIDRSRGGLVAARTRSGGNAFRASLRDTMANSSNFVEGNAGGVFVENKLWVFAGAWNGDDAWRGIEEARGFFAKLTAQPLGVHHLELSHLDDGSFTTLHYDGTIGGHTTVQALASRSASRDTLSFRASHVAGDHVLSAGASRFEQDNAFFVSDRWSAGHWTVNAGARYEDEDFAPRAALSYDLHGDGRRAFFASWGEYANDDLATLGFATAIGTTGSARIDAIRRDDFEDEVRVSAHYRLFDRFEAGAMVAHADDYHATAWAGAEMPVGDHEIGVTLFARSGSDRDVSADLALRYAVPLRSVRLTFASDATNLLDAKGVSAPRALRFWFRATL